MVLQNKYKAKASRRYNAAKGGPSQQGDRSEKPGFRQRQAGRFGPGHRGPSNASEDDQDDASEDGEDDEEDNENEEGEQDGGDEIHDPRFPSLQSTAKSSHPQRERASARSSDSGSMSRGKYSRRKIGESNAARMARLEAEKDPHMEQSEEEPEIDISALVARVKALDPNAQTQAGVSADIAAQLAERETASDVEKDIDHSLAWLHEKEMKRQKAKGRGGWTNGRPDAKRSDSHPEMKDVDADGNKIDYERLRRDKEKAEALRALKARFQGRALGEREAKGARSRPVPSIKIGPHRDVASDAPGGSDAAGSAAKDSPAPSSTYSGSGSSDSRSAASTSSTPPTGADRPAEGTSGTCGISDSMAAEIDASFNRQRKQVQSRNDDAGSVSSQRSSFSTDFGRRRSPMSIRDYDASIGACPPTDEIDSFLSSLSPPPTRSADPRASPSSSLPQERRRSRDYGDARISPTRSSKANASAVSSTSADANPTQERIHRLANPGGEARGTPQRGEIESLESFLDDMLK
ncbi:hypothetical protein ACQY0O_000156 [Thecaphora frezii]